MPILTPNNLQFTITDSTQTLDISKLIYSADASYSSALTNSGLVTITGSLELHKTLNVPINLDDRFNNIWSSGSKIRVTENNFPVAIIGTAFVENSTYNAGFQEQTLQLNITCTLGFHNRFNPGELGVCVNINEGVSKLAAISTLLDKAGISDYDLGSFGTLIVLFIVV